MFAFSIPSVTSHHLPSCQVKIRQFFGTRQYRTIRQVLFLPNFTAMRFTVCVKKNATRIKISAARFDKKRAALLWFASGFVREAYCDTFYQTCHDFCQHAVIWRNMLHFHGKSIVILGKASQSRIAALFKTMHFCG